MKLMVRGRNYIIWVSILFLIGLTLRLIFLDRIPEGLFNDEGLNGNEALTSLKNGSFPVFYEANNGREGLFIWLIAFFLSFLEPGIFSIKAASCFIGSLTVLVLPFSISEIVKTFQSKESINNPSETHFLGITVMALLAFSSWHLIISRLAFRVILDPLFTVLSLGLICYAINRNKVIPWVLAGVATGMGLYGYGTFKFICFPIIFLLMFAAYNKKLSLKSIIGSVFFAITLFPLAKYIFLNPEKYFSRLSAVSIFSTPNPLSSFIISFWKVLQMPIGIGDANQRHNIPFNSLMDPSVSIFFLIGICLLMIRLFRSNTLNLNNLFPKSLSIFLLTWYFSMLIPAALTIEELPHALRSSGIILPYYIIAGLGLGFVLKQLHNQLIPIVLTSFTIVYITSSVLNYFVRFPRVCAHAFVHNYSTILAKQHIETELDAGKNLFVIENGYRPMEYWHAQSILFLLNQKLDAHNTKWIELKDLNSSLNSYDRVTVYAPEHLQLEVRKNIGDSITLRWY